MEGSWNDRRAAGRAARKAVPRSAHAGFDPAPGRDPLAILEQQAETRVPDLVPIRHGRMAGSPFAFFRGGAAVMAHDLAGTPTTGFRVQACGDAHVSNFGKYKTPERNLVFDINDFDETLAGPWEWDVKRLVTSLHVIARQRGFAPNRCDSIVAAATRAYRERMEERAPTALLQRWYARTDADDVVAHLPARFRTIVQRDVRRALRKGQRRAVAKFTRDDRGVLRFVEDPPLLVHFDGTDADRDEVVGMVERYQETLTGDRQALFSRLRLRDIARKVVGVGSVGTRCWICLFEGPDRPGGDHVVLQVKEAQASVLEPHVGESSDRHVGESPDRHHGMRVVLGQRLTQAASDIFLGWTGTAAGERQYYVRQLWDAKGGSDPMAMDARTLREYGVLCALVLAQAHARTGDPAPIASYLGTSDSFDRAMVTFARAYADLNERDHAALVEAIESGRFEAHFGI